MDNKIFKFKEYSVNNHQNAPFWYYVSLLSLFLKGIPYNNSPKNGVFGPVLGDLLALRNSRLI
jgi:hypothetical protein